MENAAISSSSYLIVLAFGMHSNVAGSAVAGLDLILAETVLGEILNKMHVYFLNKKQISICKKNFHQDTLNA